MKKGILIALGAIVIAVVVLCGWAILQVKDMDTFIGSTKINGVDCSGLSEEEAASKLTEKWNSKEFVIKENGNTIGTIKNLDLKYDISDTLKEHMKGDWFSLIMAYYKLKDNHFDMNMNAKGTKSFEKQFKALDFLDDGDSKKTENAYVDLSTEDFNVVKEVYGTNMDRSKFKKAILADISKGDFDMKYVPKNYYMKPTVTSDSQAIKDRKEYCKKYLTMKITYDFDDRQEVISPTDLDKMFKVSDDGKRTVKKKAVDDYVLSLAKKYNTFADTRKFKGKVIYGGDYGWIIDKKKEAKHLISLLKEGKDQTVVPVYSQTARSRKKNDIGKSYVEISLSGQHLWVYIKGKEKVSTDVVTGNISMGSGTPSGVYRIAYKERNKTLRGADYDGSQYASPVSYWMPFNGGIGMHDATWRGAFGGSIYLSNGSHGCVNMPSWAAGETFKYVSTGFPVVVYE